MLSSYVYGPGNVCFIKDSGAISERLSSVLPIKDQALAKEGLRDCREKEQDCSRDREKNKLSFLGESWGTAGVAPWQERKGEEADQGDASHNTHCPWVLQRRASPYTAGFSCPSSTAVEQSPQLLEGHAGCWLGSMQGQIPAWSNHCFQPCRARSHLLGLLQAMRDPQ